MLLSAYSEEIINVEEYDKLKNKAEQLNEKTQAEEQEKQVITGQCIIITLGK